MLECGPADVDDRIDSGLYELLSAGGDLRVYVPEIEEVVNPGIHLLCGWGAGGGDERIGFCGTAGRKASGEVLTIVGVPASGHGEFVAGVELRGTAGGDKEGESKFEFLGVSSGLAEKTYGVVIAEEENEALRVGVEGILAEDVFDT